MRVILALVEQLVAVLDESDYTTAHTAIEIADLLIRCRDSQEMQFNRKLSISGELEAE